MRHVAEVMGVKLTDPSDWWLADLSQSPEGAQLLRRAVRYTTLSTARVLDGPIFLKPSGEKAFPARVYRDGRDLADVTQAYEGSMGVLASTPVKFSVEYRCFMLHRQVATASIYMRDGALAARGDEWPCDPSELTEAVTFANTVGSYCSPGRLEETPLLPRAVVLDVGKTDTGSGDSEWAVVEANPCWGSGLCGCDPSVVLTVLQQATTSE